MNYSTKKNMRLCAVMGCGRKADHIMVSNPFAPDQKFNFCDRCLAAGKQAVDYGEKELTAEIYRKYYIQYPGR